MNRKVILKGIDTGGGKPIVDANKNGSAITLAANANEITLEGFTAKNTANGAWPTAGILVKSQKNIIKNNAVGGNDNGIVLYYSNNNELSGNEASGNGNGIYLDYSNYNNLSNNTLNSDDNGIIINSAGNNSLSGNSVRLSNQGIYLVYAGNNTVINNIADSNFYGIKLEGRCNNNIIKNNILTHNNRGSTSAGIYLMYDSNYNTITDNNISDNNFGFYFYYSSSNVIYRNNIRNNVNQAFDIVKSGNIWNGDYSLGGNYWNDYAATATDVKKGANQDEEGSDGIGDAPYKLPYDSGTDKYPLMSF